MGSSNILSEELTDFFVRCYPLCNCSTSSSLSSSPLAQMKEPSLAIQGVGSLGHLLSILQGLPPVTNTSIIGERKSFHSTTINFF